MGLMKSEKNTLVIQTERRILLVRGKNIMLDYDIAALYEVESNLRESPSNFCST